jgi:hypothetical protein
VRAGEEEGVKSKKVVDKPYPLLILCARLNSDAPHRQQVVQAAGQFTAWADLLSQAKAQGLESLLYHHLHAAGASLPPQIKRELQARYVRHGHANQVQTQALVEILTAYEAAGIEALVLKGAALAHLIYPQPGLRPMRDVDILVKKSEVRQGQQILAELGYYAPVPSAAHLPDKHLATATRRVEGLLVSVELHHNLYHSFQPVSLTIEGVTGPPLAFPLAGVTAHTLGYEDMLAHLCEHVAFHASIWEPIRLIWVADIVGFAELFAVEIDWDRLAWQQPYVLKVLSLFHFVTPLSDRLHRLAPLKLGYPPRGIGQEFAGFPRFSLAEQRGKGYRQMLYDAFYPSEWWLRLHYRLDSAQSLLWYRWFRHPLYILGPFYLAEKVRLLWFQQLRWRLGRDVT